MPTAYYWIYPHPQNLKSQKAKLEKRHNEKIAEIREMIETAKKHQNSGTRVYGGAEPWAQAERDELTWKVKLSEENDNYNNSIAELEKFPLTNALVLIGISLAATGLFLAVK